MRRAWRIVKEKHAASAFDGEGAWLYGGRWNSKGTRVVYLSSSLSLAALECLVHLTPPVMFQYVVMTIDFDESMVETLPREKLRGAWTESPPPPSVRHIGDLWARESRSLVLDLPSVIIPSETNFLLNPRHPDFAKVTISQPVPFTFDRRLI